MLLWLLAMMSTVMTIWWRTDVRSGNDVDGRPLTDEGADGGIFALPYSGREAGAVRAGYPIGSGPQSQ